MTPSQTDSTNKEISKWISSVLVASAVMMLNDVGGRLAALDRRLALHLGPGVKLAYSQLYSAATPPGSVFARTTILRVAPTTHHPGCKRWEFGLAKPKSPAHAKYLSPDEVALLPLTASNAHPPSHNEAENAFKALV